MPSLEKSCAEYIALVRSVNGVLQRAAGLDLIHHRDRFMPDSTIGAWGEYLEACGVSDARGKKMSNFRRILRTLWRELGGARDLLGRELGSVSSSQRRCSVSFLLYLEMSRGSSVSGAVRDFVSRRASLIHELEASGRGVLVFVMCGDYASDRDLENAGIMLRKLVNCDVHLVYRRSHPYFVRLRSIFCGTARYFRLWWVVGRMLDRGEFYKILLKELLNFGPSVISKYGLDEISLRQAMQRYGSMCFVTTYSFARKEALVIKYVKESGGQVLDYAPRIYSRSRPSNMFLEDYSEQHAVPDRFLVATESCKASLTLQGVGIERINVSTALNVNEVDLRRANSSSRNGICLLLQREKDGAVGMVSAIKDVVMNNGLVLYLKFHPRFLQVRQQLLDSGVLDGVPYVEVSSISACASKCFVAITAFSSAGIEARSLGLALLWAPFLSRDSGYVEAVMAETGMVSLKGSDLRLKLKYLLANRCSIEVASPMMKVHKSPDSAAICLIDSILVASNCRRTPSSFDVV